MPSEMPKAAVAVETLTRERTASLLGHLVLIGDDVAWNSYDEQSFLKELDDKWALSQITLSGGEITGYAIVSRKSGDAAHLHQIMIGKGFRGRGLGRLLMSQVEEAAVAHGLRFVTLSVHDDNVAAKRMYERLGYRRIDAREGYDHYWKAL